MLRAMPVDQGRLDAAIDALSDRERFREAESVVAAAAPKLQRILADALEEGGWFGEAHEAEVRKAAAAETTRSASPPCARCSPRRRGWA